MANFVLKCPFCGDGELIKSIANKTMPLNLVTLDENKQLDAGNIKHLEVKAYRCNHCGFVSLFSPDIIGAPVA